MIQVPLKKCDEEGKPNSVVATGDGVYRPACGCGDESPEPVVATRDGAYRRVRGNGDREVNEVGASDGSSIRLAMKGCEVSRDRCEQQSEGTSIAGRSDSSNEAELENIFMFGDFPSLPTSDTKPSDPVGSGLGLAPAADEAAKEQRVPDQEAERSMPKPVEFDGERTSAATSRRAGKCGSKARLARKQCLCTAQAEVDLNEYVIEPNTPTTANDSSASLKTFLRCIGADEDIRKIIEQKLNEGKTWNMRDSLGGCTAFRKTQNGMRVDIVGPYRDDGHVMPITTDDGEDQLLPVTDWQDVEIEITLDSGCCEHVLDRGEVPGYVPEASPGSMRKQNFVVGNGSKVPNEGQVKFNLQADVGGKPSLLRSCFQVAEITRPLMSVSRICDQDLVCVFTKQEAIIKDKEGNVICNFQRRGGLYVTTMRLKRPSPPDDVSSPPFGRQAP